ncbi:MAG: DsbA family protein [Pseudomonadota bacterium]|nr:DsbA family protein [Pseudomonadota bacterium]
MSTIRFARAAASGFLLAVAGAASAQSPQPATLKVDGPYAIGRADAPVTMVEFSDFECSFCQRYHVQAFEEIKKNFIDTGKLRYVVRDYPLPFHRRAVPAARTARCAGEQGKFWEMRHALMSGQSMLDMESMIEAAGKLKLDEAKLRACIASFKFDKSIRKDMADADSVGVNSTPSFLIGRTRGDSVVGERMDGSQPYAAYESRIKALLDAR